MSTVSDLFTSLIIITSCISFFFFNEPAPTEIYTLSLHDALPIYDGRGVGAARLRLGRRRRRRLLAAYGAANRFTLRSEEHTSELQSRQYLVCRLLLEKKKKNSYIYIRQNKSHNHTELQTSDDDLL